MCKVISIINNKGGVGKTTSTGIIAQLLAYLGKHVLVVDLDSQSNLSMMLGQYEEDSQDIIEGLAIPEHPNIAELLSTDIVTLEMLLNLSGTRQCLILI